MTNLLYIAQQRYDVSNFSEQTLSLITQNKKNIQLARTRLEQWFARLAMTHTTEHQFSQTANKIFNRFGIKSTADIIHYLNSPAGQNAKAILEDYLDAVDALKQKNINFELKEHARKHFMFILYLLLGLIHKKEALAKRLEEYYQEQAEESLKQELKQEQKTSETKGSDILENKLLLKDYTAIEEALNERLEGILKEAESLEKELTTLNEEQHNIDSRFSTYYEELDKEELHLLHPNALTKKMEDVNVQLSSYARILSTLLNQGNETEIRQHMDLTNALNLKLTLLNDLRLVQQEEKQLLNKNGEQVDSITQADFMIPKDKSLKLEKGQYYLYPRSKDFEKLSTEERDDARNDYQLSLQQIMSIKMQLQLKQSKELSIHNEKKNNLVARSEVMQQQIHLLATQLSENQSNRAIFENKMKQQPNLIRTPTLAPQNNEPARQIQSPPSVSSLQKPPTQYNVRNTIINQCLIHIENLMNNTPTSQTTTSKQRLEQIKHLQQLQTQNLLPSQIMMSPGLRPTPFSTKPSKG